MKKLLTFILMILSSHAFAWDNVVTHRDISDISASLSLSPDLLKKIYSFNGINKRLAEWIQDGSELEDAGSNFTLSTARFRNHFHNPLANLNDAGLSDLLSGESALLWAQDGANQTGFVRGDWSWQTVRNHYYRSLTATTKTEADEFTVRTYLGLGYQMHLVQDMSQPEHVRNDAHPVDGAGIKGIETWAKGRPDLIRQYAASATTKPTVDLTLLLNELVPVGRLMDTRRYISDRTPSSDMNQGLAEYTNANFFSDDTIFAARFATDDKHYFPYPRKEGTDIQAYFSGTKSPETVQSEDGKAVKGLWISKNGEGEAVPHLVRVGPLADFVYSIFGEGTLFYGSLYRDEITYEDYARLLIPRAVAYSAAFLDYFFRGNIELSLPLRGVYALALPTDSFNEIRVKAKNLTASGEEMSNGLIQLVVRYKLALFDPFQSQPVDVGPDIYIVVPEKNNVKIIPKGTPTELVFDLSTSPLPLWATNVYLQVVYHGQLGAEADAVAVGFRDISEPTPMDVFNNADKICINGEWYNAGSPEAIAKVDTNRDGIADEWDVYAYDIANIFAKASSSSSATYASASNFTFSAPEALAGGNLRRLGYILTDYSFTYSFSEDWLETDPKDPWENYTTAELYLGTAVKNQTDSDGIHRYPIMYTFRGNKMWSGAGGIYMNWPYPDYSECDWGAL